MSYILSIDFGNRNIKTAVYNPRLVENPNSPEAVREFEKVEPQRNLGDYNGGPLRNIANIYVTKTRVGVDNAVGVPKTVEDHVKYYMTKKDWKRYVECRQQDMSAMEIAGEEYKYIYETAKKQIWTEGGEDLEVIVTVPATFSKMQKYHVRKAIMSQLPDINLVEIITEPFAGLFSCYDLFMDTSRTEDFYTLVFDIGAGTLDMSLFQISPGEDPIISTLVSMGMEGVAGDAITKCIYNHCLKDMLADAIKEEIKEDFENFFLNRPDIPAEDKDPGSEVYQRHYNESRTKINQNYFQKVESLKRVLCGTDDYGMSSRVPDYDAVIAFDKYFYTPRVKVTGGISLNQLEALLDNAGFFSKIEEKLTEMLKLSALNKEDISRVLVVGGSANVPYYQKKLKQFLNPDASPERDLQFVQGNFDRFYAVAVGACVYSLCKKMNFRIGSYNAYEIGILDKENRYIRCRSNMLLPETPSLPRPVALEDQGVFLCVNMYQLFEDCMHISPENVEKKLVYMGYFRLDPAVFSKDKEYFLSLHYDENENLIGEFYPHGVRKPDELIASLPLTLE